MSAGETSPINALESVCPGCGLRLPRHDRVRYDGGFHTSAECWEVFTEVLGKEFNDPRLFGLSHQLTVDAYAVQHAGGNHRDKSVVIHLCGLHLVLDRGLPPTGVAPLFQRLASAVPVWPHLVPPGDIFAITVFDVALAQTAQEHAKVVRTWASVVWRAWSSHHQQIRRLVAEHLDAKERHGSYNYNPAVD